MKLVRDVMQKDVATLRASDHLDVADDVMRLGRVRHMPVVDGDTLVGILSQRDLFRAGISSALHFRVQAEREWLAKIVVREVMTTPAISVAPDTSLHQAVVLMLEKRIGCLPVVEGNALAGLLSESDLLRYLDHLLVSGAAG